MSDVSARREAARNLRRHIAECKECQGPGIDGREDGCDEGQLLESRCIDELKFDPYKLQTIPPAVVPNGEK